MHSIGGPPTIPKAARERFPAGRRAIPIEVEVGQKRETDAALVAQVLAGNVDAFAELYRTHVGDVRRVVAEHVREREAAADAVQDTFARALEHLPSLRDHDRFRPWLLSIARHAATDRLRSGRRLTGLDDGDADAIATSEPGPELVAELRELAEHVRGCIAGLTQRDATAIVMVTHLGFTPDQVGAAFGLSHGAAKVLVHRARRRLRHAIMLQLMVRQSRLGCEEFRSLLPADPLAAGRHLDGCTDCINAAAKEVSGFDLGATSRLVGAGGVRCTSGEGRAAAQGSLAKP
jgi:RNA polymerase sigma factor (sigma-70 family)